MPKINKLEIKNFRNIKEATYSFTNETSILAGKNGIGKSNTLNALMWFLSSTVITDSEDIISKGEMDTIIPRDFKKGMDTEVSITLESGMKFTKKYKTKYQRGTDIVNGHTTDLLINDVPCQNENQFLEELYPQFNFKPSLTRLNVKETNLFMDPLYALQKLDSKELRNLLVALGCSVSNEEVYLTNPNFEVLHTLEAKYNYKFDVMRTDLKKQKDAIVKEQETLEAMLKPYADVVEFDAKPLEENNKKKQALIIQKNNFLNGDSNAAINALDVQIKELNMSKEKNKNERISLINSQIRDINNKIELEKTKSSNEVKTETQSLSNKIERLKEQIGARLQAKDAYDLTILNADKQINKCVLDAKKNNENKNDYTVKLNTVMGRSYNNFITCPCCGKTFPASQESLDNFNKDKQDNIKMLKDSISQCQANYVKLGKEVEEQELLKKNAMSETTTNIAETNVLKEELNAQETNLRNIQVVYSNKLKVVIEALNKQAKELEDSKYLKTSEEESFDYQIAAIEQKKKQIEEASSQEIQSQINAIEMQLVSIEDSIKELYVQESQWKTKIDYEAKLSKCKNDFNDIDYLYKLANSFIQTMISKINDKAILKTGIHFVMMEDQLNGGVKETCYATLDGIPFESLNTSKKIELGIKFIEKIKDITVSDFGVEHNHLPVLADKLESIDSIDKIRSFTKEQLICTKVSDEETITII